eukprot:3648183-Rhodomonas_salina.3
MVLWDSSSKHTRQIEARNHTSGGCISWVAHYECHSRYLCIAVSLDVPTLPREMSEAVQSVGRTTFDFIKLQRTLCSAL